jgi:hypothetical protein
MSAAGTRRIICTGGVKRSDSAIASATSSRSSYGGHLLGVGHEVAEEVRGPGIRGLAAGDEDQADEGADRLVGHALAVDLRAREQRDQVLPVAVAPLGDDRQEVLGDLPARAAAALDRVLGFVEVRDRRSHAQVPLGDLVVVLVGDAEHLARHRDRIEARELGDEVEARGGAIAARDRRSLALDDRLDQVAAGGPRLARQDRGQRRVSRPGDHRHEALQAGAGQERVELPAVLGVLAPVHLEDRAAVELLELPRVVVRGDLRMAEDGADVLVPADQPGLDGLVEVQRVLLAQELEDLDRVGLVLRRHQRRHGGADSHLLSPLATR